MAEEVAGVGDGVREAEGRVALASRGLESDWDPAEFRAFWERFAVAFGSAVAARSAPDAEPDAAPDRPRD